MNTSTKPAWTPKPGEAVHHPFDSTTGTVVRVETKYRRTVVMVMFPGKAPREVYLEQLESAR